MRRFLLHVLPSGFHRIRHYGLLANANRQRDIATARDLLHQPAPTPPADPGDGSADHGCPRPTFVCRHCGAPMLVIETFARAQHIRGPPGSSARTMIDIASINKTFTAAFSKMMPPRTPVASCCKTFHCRHDSRLLNARCGCVLGSPPTHIDHAGPDDLRLTGFCRRSNPHRAATLADRHQHVPAVSSLEACPTPAPKPHRAWTAQRTSAAVGQPLTASCRSREAVSGKPILIL